MPTTERAEVPTAESVARPAVEPPPKPVEQAAVAPSTTTSAAAVRSDSSAEPAIGDGDETTLYGPLPEGFWEEDDPAAPLAPAGLDDRAGPTPAEVEERPDHSEPAERPAGGSSMAELQELFPGRILEFVREKRTPPGSGLADETEPAGDEGETDAEGYDDPDQAQLSFGPSD